MQPPVIIHGKKCTEASPRAGRPECELWGVTRANALFWRGRLTDWTAWVDTHPLVQTNDFVGIPERRPDSWRWMLDQDGTRPIYLMAPEDHPQGVDRELAQRLFEQVPGATPFPIREIQRAFPINGEPNRMFICQLGMMIAFALYRGAPKIILNGCGMSSRADFQIAHIDTPYWIGFARGRGVDVVIEGPSTYHAPSKIYSYEKLNHAEVDRARREEKVSLAEIEAMDETNRRERARGRPDKFRYRGPR